MSRVKQQHVSYGAFAIPVWKSVVAAANCNRRRAAIKRDADISAILARKRLLARMTLKGGRVWGEREGDKQTSRR
jgi:hypothetical protein